MDQPKEITPPLLNTFQFTGRILRREPRILIPFAIFFILELGALLLLLAAPRAPLDRIFAPIIRTFWGEAFLHYPIHFLLFPKLDYLFHLLLSIFYGPIMAATAVSMIQTSFQGKSPSALLATQQTIRRYPPVFFIVLITTALVFLTSQIILFGLHVYFSKGYHTLFMAESRLWMGPLFMATDFFITLLIQSLLIYCIPLIVIKHKGFIAALSESIRLFKKLSWKTLFLVGFPMFFYIPVIILLANAPLILYKVSPEVILLTCVAGAAVNTLLIDALITIGTTHLFLSYTEKT